MILQFGRNQDGIIIPARDDMFRIFDVDNWTDQNTTVTRGGIGGSAFLQAREGQMFAIKGAKTSGMRTISNLQGISVTVRYEPAASTTPFETIQRVINSASNPVGCIRYTREFANNYMLFPVFVSSTQFVASILFQGISTSFACAPAGERTNNTAKILFTR